MTSLQQAAQAYVDALDAYRDANLKDASGWLHGRPVRETEIDLRAALSREAERQEAVEELVKAVYYGHSKQHQSWTYDECPDERCKKARVLTKGEQAE